MKLIEEMRLYLSPALIALEKALDPDPEKLITDEIRRGYLETVFSEFRAAEDRYRMSLLNPGEQDTRSH